MKIQLLTFPGCPNAEPARAALREAIAKEHVTDPIEEIDVARDDPPPWTKGWGSPTILVDGRDIAGEAAADGEASCRLYKGGAPSVRQICAGLRTAMGAPARSGCGDLVRSRPAWLRWGSSSFSVIGAVVAAIAASACCLVPAVL